MTGESLDPEELTSMDLNEAEVRMIRAYRDGESVIARVGFDFGVEVKFDEEINMMKVSVCKDPLGIADDFFRQSEETGRYEFGFKEAPAWEEAVEERISDWAKSLAQYRVKKMMSARKSLAYKPVGTITDKR